MKENAFQAWLIRELKDRLPGCLVLKNDATYIQGIPDLTVLYGSRWAALEVKASPRARQQPNQQHYIDRLDEMSFAAFIYPENAEEILDALCTTLEPGW